VEACEVSRVDAVGLDVCAASARDERGRDHVARNTERGDQTVGVVAGGAGLVGEEGESRVVAAKEPPDASGVFGITLSSTSVVPGRSTATAIVSLCTSSPM